MKVPGAVERCIEESGGLAKLESVLPTREELRNQARLFHALSDEIRLKIITVLAEIPSCVCVLKEVTGMSDSRLSYHLNLLREVGLIGSVREKNWIIYNLTDKGKEIVERQNLRSTSDEKKRRRRT